MDYAILTGFVLVTGVVLAVVAQWKGWRPSLLTVLAVGVAFRVLIMTTSAMDTWQPVDFVESFKPAGEAILNREDPVLGSEGGWHFLPTIPYVYGLLLWLGIPWEIGGRLVTVVADIALIPLVGKLAGGSTASLRAFQYACNPLAILVASVHGQVEPVALVFGVAAFVVARGPGDPDRPGLTTDVERVVRRSLAHRGLAGAVRHAVGPGGVVRRTLAPRDDREVLRRALFAGLLMGLALCAKSWPIWLIPGMLLLLPTVRARVVAFAATGIAPVFFLVTLPVFAGTSLDQIPEVIRVIQDIRPIVGEWGYSAIWVGGDWTLHQGLTTFGTRLIYLTLLATAFVWRRADPVDLTTAMLLAFMVVTPRLGAQYLMWFMPFLVARPTRFAWPAIIGVSLWAGYGYLYMTQFDTNTWWYLHSIWAQVSVVLLPVLALAMPWWRRISPASAEGDRAPRPTPAPASV
ncbi:hypothetical protein FHS43_001359 [Streptosporangium becharense]|uniref:DUF2029 domain-containing protein n=1 Tax=Streptosporangium becharense TaxID=1816182 RepID=A0A7W9IDW9_9ACTN|nr:hypothetical protein [Streptosporangium becharense]MBB2910113.1 hypothetical protein [Streptosporangium becharense]MBB5818932.1 hypothetical protein [Streptosporangium becharense]